MSDVFLPSVPGDEGDRLRQRLARAPDRHVFKIDVGTSSPEVVDEYIRRLRVRLKQLPPPQQP